MKLTTKNHQESQLGCLHSIWYPFIGEPSAPAGVTGGAAQTLNSPLAPVGTVYTVTVPLQIKEPTSSGFWSKVCCYRCCLICIFIIFNYVGEGCPHVSAPRKGNSSPRTKVTGGCEPPNMRTWNQMWVLYNNNTCS